MIKPSEYLETFKKSKSFSRPNLFAFEMFPPSELNISSVTLEHISSNCKSTQIPGKTLDAQQHVDGGYIPTQLPFNMTYQSISTMFRCSADLKEKTFFEEWQKLIYNETTNTLGWYEDFIGTVSISQLSRNGNVLAKYHLYEVWPGSISPIEVSYDSTDAISELSVTLNYRQYRLTK